MWDWGSAAFNAVIVTFVFSVYLTDSVGADLDGPFSAATWLSISIAVAGLVIALTAPVMGQRADRGGRRRRASDRDRTSNCCVGSPGCRAGRGR